jgi:uncharacterized coiled-coil DUF342 family protein
MDLAAEVERLRAELAGMTAARQELTAAVMRLTKERDNLHETLRQIRDLVRGVS